MVLQNYKIFTEITPNMIYIVALGVGHKCPGKIHLNTQCPPPPFTHAPEEDCVFWHEVLAHSKIVKTWGEQISFVRVSSFSRCKIKFFDIFTRCILFYEFYEFSMQLNEKWIEILTPFLSNARKPFEIDIEIDDKCMKL